jgi:hypothetical protein
MPGNLAGQPLPQLADRIADATFFERIFCTRQLPGIIVRSSATATWVLRTASPEVVVRFVEQGPKREHLWRRESGRPMDTRFIKPGVHAARLANHQKCKKRGAGIAR